MRKVLLVALLVALSGGAAYYTYSHTAGGNVSLTSQDTRSNDALPQKSNNKAGAKKKVTSTVTISFDQYGFEPNDIRVPVGTRVNVENNSGTTLTFQALWGQPNQLNALNLGDVAQGSTKTFAVSKTGSWQFEANGNPALRGVIAGTARGQSTAVLNAMEMPKYNAQSGTLLINYTDYGFVPNIASVPVGTKVTVLNSTDEGGMDFEEVSGDSNPDPALNLGIISKGQQASFTLNHTGVYRYVNTWETTDMGQITAK